jgi:hypothetical protein
VAVATPVLAVVDASRPPRALHGLVPVPALIYPLAPALAT